MSSQHSRWIRTSQLSCNIFCLVIRETFSLALFLMDGCCCCSVTQSCPILCNPMDYTMPVFPVLHHLPEFDQTHVHWVSDAIHPTISSSVCPFSSHCQSFPVSGSFIMSRFFASSDQSIRASASASVLPMNIQLISFRIDWFDFLAVQGTLKSFLTPQFKSINSSVLSLLYGPTLMSIRDYWKNHSFDFSSWGGLTNIWENKWS